MRYDQGEFISPTRTPNGYLRCDARITRVGVFEYRFADGTMRRELRLPEEVFKRDSLASFEDLPLTNNHPREPLTPRNTRRYQAGQVRDVREDAEHVAARVLITDDDAIADAEAGKTQLSCGYNCDLEERAGTTCGIPGLPDGLHYDAIQRNIVGNHVAIVDKARAGASAALHLDAADAVMVGTQTKEPAGPKPGPAGGRHMSKVRIDGLDFELDEPAAQAVTKLVARADELSEQLQAAKAAAEQEKARADAAAEALEAEKKAREDATSDDSIRAAVKARVALETTAGKVLADDKLKLDEMSDEELRRAVVTKVSPAAEEKLDGADAAYLSARYDAAIDAWQAAQAAKPSASAGVRAATTPAARADALSAREKMIENNRRMGLEPIRPSTP